MLLFKGFLLSINKKIEVNIEGRMIGNKVIDLRGKVFGFIIEWNEI